MLAAIAVRGRHTMRPVLTMALAALASWGFVQLALGATEYRYATLNTALRLAALAATAVSACSFLHERPVRERFLGWTIWFSMSIAALSVLAYHTSSGKVLWWFDVDYPDVWGPFLSRNNFAQFLELTLPVALWLAVTRPAGANRGLWAAAAVMLAAGIASASRAGAALLISETIVILWIGRRRVQRAAAIFACAALFLAAIAGGNTLLRRLSHPDTMRPEIYKSTLAMIAQRPVSGYGLGTFSAVYPEYARFDAGVTIDHAHNDWLEWASDGGIPFALTWALLLAAIARPAWRSGWGIGVLALFLHALVDYPFARLGVAAWAFLLIGALTSENRSTRPALS